MRHVLGFDGGGTKTECVLMDETQKILAQSRSGPSNPTRVGFDAVLKALKDGARLALTQAHIQPESIAGICAGLAGTGRLEAGVQIRAALAVAFPGTAIRICTDLELALAAMPDGPRIVLIAGTGSAAIGRSANGDILRAGGFGPLLGDEGGAYDIGRRALIAALREHERSGRDSALGKQILRQLGIVGWVGVQERARTNAEELFPRVFPVVAAAADAGDETACTALRDAVRELTELVKDLAKRLDLHETRFNLAKMGGMIGRSPFFDAQLDDSLRAALPRAKVGPLPVPPAEMAGRLALQLLTTTGVAGN
jgi:N-acetylglucosamine kinase-like BadF-type ATPase